MNMIRKNLTGVIRIAIVAIIVLVFVIWGTVEDVNRRKKAIEITKLVCTSSLFQTNLHLCGISRFGVYTRFYYGFYVIQVYIDKEVKNIAKLKKIIHVIVDGEEIIVFLDFTKETGYLYESVEKIAGEN